jgi:hypothetical protein
MQLRLSLAVVVLAVARMLAGVTDAESRTRDAGSSLVPRIVARALPAVVSITTRQIEYDHEVLSSHRAGEAIDITVWREGQALTLQPVLREES